MLPAVAAHALWRRESAGDDRAAMEALDRERLQ